MKSPSVSTIILALALAGCASKNSAAPTPTPASSTQASAPPAQGAPVLAGSANTRGHFLSSVSKTTLATEGRDPAQFPAYAAQLKAQARQQGIDDTTLNTAFAGVHFVDHAISADRNQPENKLTLSDYLERVLTTAKIEQARDSLRQYQAQLAPVSQRSGVEPQYIVALWALESHFGTIQGREEVISALSTLAFEGRREAFFTRELMAALQIIQQQHIAPAELQGSWAGAMGQNQFMPSSFLRYGADGDGDGRIDIWHNTADVFASTANYLSKEGWKAGERWGQAAILPADFVPEMAGTKANQAKTVGEWQKLGVRLTSEADRPDPQQKAWIIIPEDSPASAFMVYDNFRTLLRWNRSWYFAISVGMMADAMSQ
ncbi:lytic murein transglycosylase [Erwinia tasmaniensis]|uniref:lytic murein transglycosylase n=1 Tax=Erwinia tasmaniensis TaxID=338565 RepID=UPI003A4E0463